MAVLSSKARDNMKSSTFGLPKDRAYPMPDKGHAVAAEARATQQLAKGNLTPSQAADIRHKAAVVLGKNDSTYHGS